MIVLLTTQTEKIALALLAILATPLVAGLFAGLAMRMRLKRYGEVEVSILQPFYGFNQLIRQSLGSAGNTAKLATLLQLAFSLLAFAMIVLQRNLLAALLLHFFSGLIAVSVVATRMVGAKTLQQTNPFKMYATYQPVILLVAAGSGLVAGGFGVAAMLGQARPLVVELPLLWLSLAYVAYISSRLEPEVFAGPLLAVTKLAGCFRQATLLLFIGVLAADSLIMAGLIALVLGYGLATAEDLRGRLNWRLAREWGWEFVYFACAINLSWVYIKYLL